MIERQNWWLKKKGFFKKKKDGHLSFFSIRDKNGIDRTRVLLYE